MFIFNTIVAIVVLMTLGKEFSLAFVVPKHREQFDIIHDDWIPVTIDIETALMRRNIKLNQHRRDDTSADREPLHLSFSGYDREFKLQLVQNHMLIARDATFFMDSETVVIDHNKFQYGYLQDMNHSSARMFVDFDEDVVSGIIHVPTENVTFIIDRPENVKLHEDPPTGTRMVLLRVVNNVTSNFDDDEGSTIERRGLFDRLKGNRKKSLCDLYLDADMTFYKQWSGNKGTSDHRRRRVFERMISYVNEVNGIYEKSVDYFKLHIVGGEIHDENNFIGKKQDAVLDEYAKWLGMAHRKLPQNSIICLNHLFIHRDAGVQGQSVMNGVCRADVETIRGSIAKNVGFTSTLTDSGTLSYWETIGTMAHEIGHNMGANHDCCKDGAKNPSRPPTPENCKDLSFCHSECDDSISGERFCSKMIASNHKCVTGNHIGDHFLMHPEISPMSVYNASLGIGSTFKFSSCSKRSIESHLKASGQCLHAPIESNLCVYCTDLSLCTCCSEGRLLPANTLCRQKSNSCQEKQAFCDGVSAFCPAQEQKPDGSYCTDSNTGRKAICKQGKCVIPHKDFCATLYSTGILNACVHEEHQCIKTCMVPDKSGSGVCVAVSDKCKALPFVTKVKKCPYSEFKTPCRLKDGDDEICNGKGSCVSCQGRCPWNV